MLKEIRLFMKLEEEQIPQLKELVEAIKKIKPWEVSLTLRHNDESVEWLYRDIAFLKDFPKGRFA